MVWFRCSLPRAPSGRLDCFSSFWGRFPRIAFLPAARTSSRANFVLPLRGAEPLRGLRCRLAIESSIQLVLTFLWFKEMEVQQTLGSSYSGTCQPAPAVASVA